MWSRVYHAEAARLSSGESGLRPATDLLALMFREGGQHVQHQPRCMGIIDRYELHPAVHQIGNERDVAGESVKLRDQQNRLMAFAFCEGGEQLRPIGTLPAFDLGVLGKEITLGPSV